jgi:2-polyprenyl-3-methyl-5-hydroxy-6-metoxy-1,4-benzoquinol methylase
MLRMVGWNKRVLELGAASGHMTAALAAQSCRVTAVEYDADAAVALKDVAEEVIVGDLNDPSTLRSLDGRFDAIVAGDVLEHLVRPQTVLDQMVSLLAPEGRIVISLPHVAHVDVRLSLLQGKFDYRDWGLLDSTHMRFFTFKTIQDMVRKAGLAIVDLQRTRIPAFETELQVNRNSVSTAVLDEILKDADAETYQFVFTAVREDAKVLVAALSAKYDKLVAEHEMLLNRSRAAEIKAADATNQLEQQRAARLKAEDGAAALTNTKLFRYARAPRRMYGLLRGRRG